METMVASTKHQTNSKFDLKLDGILPPEWVGSVCSGLSARRISVESGYAKQVQRGTWESLFEIRALDPETDLAGIDYRQLALAPKEAQGARNYPAITWFNLAVGRDALTLSIRAKDELGLLGRLLSSFSFMMLFAHEMKIETVGSEAQDMFVLRGFGGAAPTADKSERLLSTLQLMSTKGEKA